jgi:phage tail-like protein
MDRIDPLRNFRYRLEIDSIAQAGFSEVAIADTAIDAVDYREGTDPPHVRKLTGLTKYGNITLKRGLTIGGTALDLFKWHAEVSAGQVKTKRKKVVIVVQDEAGGDAARFVVTDAWPVKYKPSDLNAKGNEVVIELLELANEGIERVS